MNPKTAFPLAATPGVRLAEPISPDLGPTEAQRLADALHVLGVSADGAPSEDATAEVIGPAQLWLADLLDRPPGDESDPASGLAPARQDPPASPASGNDRAAAADGEWPADAVNPGGPVDSRGPPNLNSVPLLPQAPLRLDDLRQLQPAMRLPDVDNALPSLSLDQDVAGGSQPTDGAGSRSGDSGISANPPPQASGSSWGGPVGLDLRLLQKTAAPRAPSPPLAAAAADQGRPGPRAGAAGPVPDADSWSVADEAFRFGLGIGKRANQGQPIDLAAARAKYEQLVVQINAQLERSGLTPEARNHLLAASQQLFWGADKAGVIRPDDHLTQPYIHSVAAVIQAGDSHELPGLPSGRVRVADPPGPPASGLGRRADNAEIGIIGGGPAGQRKKNQGAPWERYITREHYQPTSTDHITIDFVTPDGKIIGSAKTIDTSAPSYQSRNGSVYYRLKSYINDVAAYNQPARNGKPPVDPGRATTRQLHVAVPESTSPAHMQQLNQAIVYGRSKGVSVIVTIIHDSRGPRPH